jgi:hypothetical protein
MRQVEKYIKEEYNKNHWPFFPAVEIINKFGKSGRDELNKMFLEKKIRPRKGMNGKLIELIK